MSNLSGYDSEAIGFDSVSLNRRDDTTSSTQTTEFGETGVASQAKLSADCGSMTTPEELCAQDDVLREYPPPGLNEFLRKVVPGMMEQLDQNDNDMLYNSSDSDEEDAILAKLYQEIKVSDAPGGGGDQSTAVLDVSWSSAGNSLAVSIGETHHENWCTHNGLIRVYTIKHAAGDKLVHNMDISEKNCISVVSYHPSVAALLAYGTTTGEVVICNLTHSVNDMQLASPLTSPSGCHGSKRVSALQWADAPLANTFLKMHINNTGKRRGASDQILISSGCDGALNVWQVNANLKIFECVVSYAVNGSRKMAAPDISCFGFIKTGPLRPCDEKVADDVFVVGTKSGSLFLCKIKNSQAILDSYMVDPVYDELDGHRTCILAVAFSFQKPGVFASVSIDSELRVYDVNQASPLKVLCLDVPISCVSWLPSNPCMAVVGVSGPGGALRLYNARSGRVVPVNGLSLENQLGVTTVAVSQSGACRVAAGDVDGTVRVWELPTRRVKPTAEDLDF